MGNSFGEYMNRLQYLMEGLKAALRFSKALDLAAEGNNEESLELMKTIPEYVLTRHSEFCALKAYLCFNLVDNASLRRTASCLEQSFMRSKASPDDIHISIYVQEFLQAREIKNNTVTEFSLLKYDSTLVSETTLRNFPLINEK